MSKFLFIFVAGIFVGSIIFELNKRSKTKSEFTHLLENLIEREADDVFVGALAKNEERFMDDLHR